MKDSAVIGPAVARDFFVQAILHLPEARRPVFAQRRRGRYRGPIDWPARLPAYGYDAEWRTEPRISTLRPKGASTDRGPNLAGTLLCSRDTRMLQLGVDSLMA